jgi:diamine N-acetyltransferase
VLVGKTVRMRAIEAGDLPLLLQWKNDPEIADYFYEYTPIPFRTQEEWYDRQRLDASELNLIADKHDGTPVGTGSLTHIDHRNRRAEAGRVLVGSKDLRDSGVGIEISALLYEYAFEHLNLNKVYSDARAPNTRIRRVNAALGGSEDGILRQHVYSQGEYVDVVVMSLLRADFFRCKNEGRTGQLYKRCLG